MIVSSTSALGILQKQSISPKIDCFCRIPKAEVEETIKETLTKLEETNQLEVDSQTNLPEELDLTQEDNKGKDKELH